ncbi:unnamed protein product [Eruca vesicaria subsp. sativa]|uniref:Uncharacterized protein n=1 Tax=Eruca vesicaria subsp. sativa TaxID=29727 RepID=A0ABC8IZA2_ERUVS|nr:unnamed protein product [Eruca vesicaria subsp. sativa]
MQERFRCISSENLVKTMVSKVVMHTNQDPDGYKHILKSITGSTEKGILALVAFCFSSSKAPALKVSEQIEIKVWELTREKERIIGEKKHRRRSQSSHRSLHLRLCCNGLPHRSILSHQRKGCVSSPSNQRARHRRLRELLTVDSESSSPSTPRARHRMPRRGAAVSISRVF